MVWKSSPRMESLASRLQGWQFPLSLLGHCWRARCPGITGNLLVTPPHPSALQMLVIFFWPVEFLRQGKGGKYIVFSGVPVPQAFPSKIPWRVKPDIGMATYSERNSLNIETVLLMHFKEATLWKTTKCKPCEWLKPKEQKHWHMRLRQWRGEAQRKIATFPPVNETIHCDTAASLQHDATYLSSCRVLLKPWSKVGWEHWCGPDCLSLAQLSLCCEKLAVLFPYLPPKKSQLFFVTPSLLTSLFTLWLWFDPEKHNKCAIFFFFFYQTC